MTTKTDKIYRVAKLTKEALIKIEKLEKELNTTLIAYEEPKRDG